MSKNIKELILKTVKDFDEEVIDEINEELKNGGKYVAINSQFNLDWRIFKTKKEILNCVKKSYLKEWYKTIDYLISKTGQKFNWSRIFSELTYIDEEYFINTESEKLVSIEELFEKYNDVEICLFEEGNERLKEYFESYINEELSEATFKALENEDLSSTISCNKCGYHLSEPESCYVEEQEAFICGACLDQLENSK